MVPSTALYANSTCPDEINRCGEWKHYYGDMSFNFGGLGGLPAVGKTGIKACLSHLEDDGALFVFVAPHVGIDQAGNLNKVLRRGQKCNSSCCGAAVGGTSPLEDDDDQMNAVRKIVQAKKPDQSLGDALYDGALEKLRKLLEPYAHIPTYILAGIQINTDVGLPEYFEPRLFEFNGQNILPSLLENVVHITESDAFLPAVVSPQNDPRTLSYIPKLPSA